MGPLISAVQRERVTAMVARARASKRMELTTGGAVRAGQRLLRRPTVIAGARQEDEIVQREVFGPVVSITPFGDAAEAVRWANDSGTDWRLRCGRATFHARLDVAARLQYGVTWINTHFATVNEMPHGGFKRSGYGKDMSVYALEDYTVVRHIMVKL